MVLDPITKKSKCFGFVQFYDDKVTENVLHMKHWLGGKKLKLEKFVPKGTTNKNFNEFDTKNEVQNQISSHEISGCSGTTGDSHGRKGSVFDGRCSPFESKSQTGIKGGWVDCFLNGSWSSEEHIRLGGFVGRDCGYDYPSFDSDENLSLIHI